MFRFSIPAIGGFIVSWVYFGVPCFTIHIRQLRIYFSIGDARDGLGSYLCIQLFHGWDDKHCIPIIEDILYIGRKLSPFTIK